MQRTKQVAWLIPQLWSGGHGISSVPLEPRLMGRMIGRGLTVPAVVLAGSAVVVGAGALDERRGSGGVDGGSEDGGEDGGEAEEDGGELHDFWLGLKLGNGNVSCRCDGEDGFLKMGRGERAIYRLLRWAISMPTPTEVETLFA
ncbi:hypothetical protein V492_04977 [Pseudogymnoascus sp. VKM F-4246]|nr:hypothetical protein V492_04977 [Pseudogymnoascus sp. VKM F-4246]